MLGTFMGCYASTLLKKYGDRKAVIILDVAGIIILLFYLIESYVVALIARFLTGILLGCHSATLPSYVRSISPSSLNEKTGSFY